MFPRLDINTYGAVECGNGGTVEWWIGGTAERRKINQNPKTRKGGDSIHSVKSGWPKKIVKKGDMKK